MRRLNLITQRLGRILTPIRPPNTSPSGPLNPFPPIPEPNASAITPTSLQDRQIQCGLPLEYTFPGYPLGKDLSPEPLPFQGDPNSYILIDSFDSCTGF